MKYLRTILLVCACIGMAQSARATSWSAVYQTDFSGDPGWVTNNSSHFYWDSTRGAYHFYNNKQADTFTYITFEFSSNQSYRLSYDIKFGRCDWGANSSFGLFDADMAQDSAVNWQVRYHRVDQGSTAMLVYYDSNGNCRPPGGMQPAPFALETWYHAEAIYNRSSGTLDFKMTRNSDGALIGMQNLSGVGAFDGVDRLAFTNVGDRYAAGVVAEGYIDNLAFYSGAPVPEPLTFIGVISAVTVVVGSAWKKRVHMIRRLRRVTLPNRFE